jgi:hypothetical protein
VFELSEGTGIPILARLPRMDESDPGVPLHSRLHAYLARIFDSPPYLMTKSRNGIMLIDYPSWCWAEEDKIPYGVANDLVIAEREGGGVLSFGDLVYIASSLTVAQLQELAVQFPVARAVQAFKPVMVQIAGFPDGADRVLRSKGVPWTPAIEQAMAKYLPSSYRNQADKGGIRALRVLVRDETNASGKNRTVTFGLSTRQQSWVPVIGFKYSAKNQP